MTGSIQSWFAAARPRTLSASIVPVAIGVALAYRNGAFRVSVAALTLVTAVLIQIGTNFANDYYDFVRGADDENRLGPARATQSGAIAPESVRNAAFAVLSIAAMCGAVLVGIGGLPVAVIGIASLVSALAYTAGPWPLAYHGLGDLFVFAFFGPVAVGGTYYLQAGVVDAGVIAASIPVGCLVTAILVVNNLRDIASDALAAKNTLAVRIGDEATRSQYTALVGAAFVVQFGLYREVGHGFALPLLVAPLAVYETVMLWRRRDEQLNQSLAGTARLLAAFGIAMVLGLVR